MPKFISHCVAMDEIALPQFSGTRVQMMPIVLGDMDSLPPMIEHYRPLMSRLFDLQARDGEIGYITIDESLVMPGKAHRKPGIHIDCGTVILDDEGRVIYAGHGGGGHGASAPRPWLPTEDSKPPKKGPTRKDPVKKQPGRKLHLGSDQPLEPIDYGMLMVSSHVGCRAWNQAFNGLPGDEGNCEHLKDQCDSSAEVILQPNTVYWSNDLCVHESLRMKQEVRRQFIRLSMPSDAPWFEGFTENPLGVMPPGVILPRREQMDYSPSADA